MFSLTGAIREVEDSSVALAERSVRNAGSFASAEIVAALGVAGHPSGINESQVLQLMIDLR